MRVTRQTKEKTRQRILKAAFDLFVGRGFYETTTRDIAAKARIATGTLFNYFPTKEALAMEIIAEALESGRDDYAKLRRGEESLAEDLFLFIITGLRKLEPHRTYLASVVETALSPFTSSNNNRVGEQVRVDHLEQIASLLAAHQVTDQPSFVVIHIYWALYLGILAFWSTDDSPNQEDTLVLLDHALGLFVASATNSRSRLEASHDGQH